MSTVTVSSRLYSPGVLSIEPVTCGECGVVFGLEAGMMQKRASDGHTFHCPNGDTISYTETEADRLKRQLKSARDNAARLSAERDQIEASRRAWKGQATKARNRVLAGECPICGQHLRDVARHVARQHPDEKPESET